MASISVLRHTRLRPENLRRQAGQRHQRIHEIGVTFAPHPGLHAAHRRAHDQPQVIHPEALGEQPVLRIHHVVVAIAREFRAQAIAGLRRLAVADAVGHHDEVLVRVQDLPGAEQFAGEFGADELRTTAARAVSDEHGVAHDALRILCGLPSVR
jgi:hypothetical protein